LLLLLVALAVGTIVVMMYMPIFDIAGGLGSGS
jgi:type II secretory pathway component PulF